MKGALTVLVLVLMGLGASALAGAGDRIVSVSDREAFDAAILKAALNRDGTKIVVTNDSDAEQPAINMGEAGVTIDQGLAGAISSPHSMWVRTREQAYGNGDMYILWGDLDDSWTESEYDKFYHVTKWLVKRGFRALINPVAYEKDVREAVMSPTTVGILWSSHGGTDGKIYDSGENPMSRNVFMHGAGKHFGQLVLSSCYGEASANYYWLETRTHLHHWVGKTTTPEYFAYLDGGDWAKDLEKDLSIKLPTSVSPDKP